MVLVFDPDVENAGSRRNPVTWRILDGKGLGQVQWQLWQPAADSAAGKQELPAVAKLSQASMTTGRRPVSSTACSAKAR